MLTTKAQHWNSLNKLAEAVLDVSNETQKTYFERDLLDTLPILHKESVIL